MGAPASAPLLQEKATAKGPEKNQKGEAVLQFGFLHLLG
jgi:hypothetical protein